MSELETPTPPLPAKSTFFTKALFVWAVLAFVFYAGSKMSEKRVYDQRYSAYSSYVKAFKVEKESWEQNQEVGKLYLYLMNKHPELGTNADMQNAFTIVTKNISGSCQSKVCLTDEVIADSWFIEGVAMSLRFDTSTEYLTDTIAPSLSKKPVYPVDYVKMSALLEPYLSHKSSYLHEKNLFTVSLYDIATGGFLLTLLLLLGGVVRSKKGSSQMV